MELNTTVSSASLASLRDQLLEKRALQQQAKLESEKAINDLRALVATFNEKYNMELIRFGLDASFVKNIDYERLGVDEPYWSEVSHKIDDICNQLYSKLKELLNV